jgi:hypothetical protein
MMSLGNIARLLLRWKTSIARMTRRMSQLGNLSWLSGIHKTVRLNNGNHDVHARLGYARADVVVLRTLRSVGKTMHQHEFAMAIGLVHDGEQLEPHRQQIQDILGLIAAADGSPEYVVRRYRWPCNLSLPKTMCLIDISERPEDCVRLGIGGTDTSATKPGCNRPGR